MHKSNFATGFGLDHAREVSPREMANAVERAKSGHPGMPMGMADVATVLFMCFFKFDPLDPARPDRDHFVLSGGHGSMARKQ
jgi:transketolase